MFSLKYTDTGELKRFRKELPAIGRRVVVRVANDAVPIAKESILRRWNIPSGVIDSAINVEESKDTSWFSGTDKPHASIVARSRRLNLAAFSAEQTPTGVSFEVRKGRKQSIPHAFIAHTLRGYGRKGGQSRRALMKVIKNLRRQKQAEHAAARAEFASRREEAAASAAQWGARAKKQADRYETATKKYQAQRMLMTALGVTRAGVFVRRGRERLPIRALYGGSIQSFFASSEVTRDLKKFCTPAIAGHMEAEIRSFFGGR